MKYSFLIAGHTTGPDRCFGIIKKSYKVNYSSSLYEFTNMVDSSPSGINKAQLVGTHNGTVLIPVYDWASFLEQFFKRLPNIKKYHHFRFSKDEPCRVYFTESNFSPEESLLLLKNRVILHGITERQFRVLMCFPESGSMLPVSRSCLVCLCTFERFIRYLSHISVIGCVAAI